MAGYTQAYQQDTLDRNHPTTGNTDHIAYSTNGTTEAGILARTAIGATGWAAATAATPSVKANSGALTSAQASGGGTVTHFAIYSASTAGVQKTDWQALGSSRILVTGDTITWAVGTVSVTLD